jgi:hypothetical protein
MDELSRLPFNVCEDEKFKLENEDETLQLAENSDVEQEQREIVANEFFEKRALLEKTKIVKQTWSISEIYQKIKDGRLILNPDYQRGEIWNNEKQTAFIESLYMEIMIPPIYVVEVPAKDMLEENKYEVVDGKQRLTAIREFIIEKLRLNERNLEYYADIFGGRLFAEIREIDPEKTSQMLSSVLDIYVITANSPEFTKYDIFARLNKGAEKLKVNEIRRAIYRSTISDRITEFVKNQLETNEDEYRIVFSGNDIKRYEDYGRFYRSVAFFLRSEIDEGVVRGYNSRPREMINNVLQECQKNNEILAEEKLVTILEKTLIIKKEFANTPTSDYIIDALIPFALDETCDIVQRAKEVLSDATILTTLKNHLPQRAM